MNVTSGIKVDNFRRNFRLISNECDLRDGIPKGSRRTSPETPAAENKATGGRGGKSLIINNKKKWLAGKSNKRELAGWEIK